MFHNGSFLIQRKETSCQKRIVWLVLEIQRVTLEIGCGMEKTVVVPFEQIIELLMTAQKLSSKKISSLVES